MDVTAARNVRDKAQMKRVLQEAGVPCARYSLVSTPGEARAFAGEVGFPLVAKPPAGAGSQATHRLDDGHTLEGWLQAMPPQPDAPALLEEFLVGQEHTFDSVTVGDNTVWSSIADYHPPPLDVLRNPWIQWSSAAAARHRRPEYDAESTRSVRPLCAHSGSPTP